MHILGKRSKLLVIVVAIVMLVTVGVSFALWDSSTVKATTGYVSYSTAQVGDVIQYGRYYQTGVIGDDGEYEKTPIEWIVVDKDERTGQLTLMSKYILACGSYFGNYYYDNTNSVWSAHYDNDLTIAGNPYNQAYSESTARAYLNNLVRFDMGGDSFDSIKGYIASGKKSTVNSGLLSSTGFSNQNYWTGLNLGDDESNINNLLNNDTSGLKTRADSTEIYYQRPINNEEYKARPATKGFYDEAFNDEEKSMIVPRVIGASIAHRWPDSANDVSTNSNIEGIIDKVWLPSATELNIMNGQDWNGSENDAWTIPSDNSTSTVFKYFKNYNQFINPFKTYATNNVSLAEALYSKRTEFAKNSFSANYSIPVYLLESNGINKDIDAVRNASDNYWTRSPSSYWFNYMRIVNGMGKFDAGRSSTSYIGVRPCIMLKY